MVTVHSLLPVLVPSSPSFPDHLLTITLLIQRILSWGTPTMTMQRFSPYCHSQAACHCMTSYV